MRFTSFFSPVFVFALVLSLFFPAGCDMSTMPDFPGKSPPSAPGPSEPGVPTPDAPPPPATPDTPPVPGPSDPGTPPPNTPSPSPTPEPPDSGPVWYISATGSDSNDGTNPSKSLASVSKALSLIRAAYRRGNWKAGDSAIIVIRGTIVGHGSFGSNMSMVDVSGAGNYPHIILKGDRVTGGVLNANRSISNQGRVLYIANNKVTLGDNLTLTGGYTLWGGAVCVGTAGSPSEGEFVMAGGEISGNTGGLGGGVLLYKGNMSMTGGTIKNNVNAVYSNVSGGAGGVYVYEYNSFTLSGGTISANGGTSTENGGGVFVDGRARFVMTGGDILGNSSSSLGGGVYVTAFGEFNLAGGTISRNSSAANGGVYISSYGAIFTQTGGTISGNIPN